MVDFDTATLINIAKLTGLRLNDDEIAAFSSQLQTILTYSEQLNQVSKQVTPEDSTANMNVFRDDKALKTSTKEMLLQAPQVEDTFFVVPQILP